MTDDPTLAALGISADQEDVYRTLVERGPATVAEVSRPLGMPQEDVRLILSALEEKGLLSRIPGRLTRFSAAPPNSALEMLILQRREELERARLAAERLQERFRSVERTSTADLVEVVLGPENILRRIRQLRASVREEMLTLDAPPYLEQDPDFEPIERIHRLGVRMRTVYDRRAAERPGHIENLRRFAQLGEEARTAESVPVKLLIVDRSFALIPLEREDPGRGALIVRPSALLEAMVTLFETVWEHGFPVRLQGSETDITQLEPSDRAVLTLLGAGLKDEAIARQIGAGVRTVQRRISHLMERARANTRFQLGIVAEREGWVTSDGNSSETDPIPSSATSAHQSGS